LWKVKLWLFFPLLEPTQSDARLSCSYTVRGQHITTWHQDSITFFWNVHSKTVWTLHWYYIVTWYWYQYKILESKPSNWQWVSRPPVSFGNTYRFLKIISGPICTTGAKTCQQDCHYCSVLQLSVGTTVIIPSAHLKVTFMANISVSMCELYNSQPGLCYETLFDCMCLQIL